MRRALTSLTGENIIYIVIPKTKSEEKQKSTTSHICNTEILLYSIQIKLRTNLVDITRIFGMKFAIKHKQKNSSKNGQHHTHSKIIPKLPSEYEKLNIYSHKIPTQTSRTHTIVYTHTETSCYWIYTYKIYIHTDTTT